MIDDDEDGEDKRRHRRVHVDLKIGIIQSDNKIVYARIKDLSEGGVYLSSEYGADKGKEFRIIFQLQEGAKFLTVKAKAKVVYVTMTNNDMFGLGLQFSWVDPQGLKSIKDYIRSRMTR